MLKGHWKYQQMKHLNQTLRSESPIVLPSVSVKTNLVAELTDVDPADCPEVPGTDGENDSGLTLGV